MQPVEMMAYLCNLLSMTHVWWW